jgi:hypothetical protein
MYNFIKSLYLIVKFKKEKKDFEFAAKWYSKYLPEGEDRDKNVGASLMSAEQSQSKYEATLKVLFGK